MTFEITIQYVLDFMSEDCLSREDALSYIFSPDKGHFYWKDGQLINDWLESVSKRRPLRISFDKCQRAAVSSLSAQLSQQSKRMNELRIKRLAKLVEQTNDEKYRELLELLKKEIKDNYAIPENSLALNVLDTVDDD